MSSERNTLAEICLYVSVFFLLIFLLVFVKHVSAVSVSSWLPSSVESIGQAGDSGSDYDGQILTLSSNALITSLTFRSGSGQPIASPNSMDYVLMNSAGTILSSTTITNQATSSAGSTYTINIPDVSLNAGTYFIGSQYNSGTGITKGYSSSSASQYLGGCYWLNQSVGSPFSLSSCSSSEVRDVYFSLNSDVENYISIEYPVSGSTNMGNFGLWRIQYLSSSTNTLHANIFVSATSSVSNVSYDWFDQEPLSNSSGVMKNAVLNRVSGEYASGTTYYAVAYLYGTSTILASSSVVSFSIADVDSEYVFPVFQYPDFVSSFGEQTSQICTKMPFAYFCDVGALFSSLNATTSSSSLPVLAVSLPFPVGSSTSISIISADGIRNTIGASTLALMRSLIAYGLWIGLGLHIIHRIRNFHV